MYIKFQTADLSVHLKTPVVPFPSYSLPCRDEHCCDFGVYYPYILIFTAYECIHKAKYTAAIYIVNECAIAPLIFPLFVLFIRVGMLFFLIHFHSPIHLCT